MYGSNLSVEFKGWEHNKLGTESNVFTINPDDVKAHFTFSTWQADKGKISLRDIYHTLDSLLEFEECLICTSQAQAFSDGLAEITKALKAYKGKANISPKPHSPFDESSGYYLR